MFIVGVDRRLSPNSRLYVLVLACGNAFKDESSVIVRCSCSFHSIQGSGESLEIRLQLRFGNASFQTKREEANARERQSDPIW